jgi:type II secretory pathway component PulF
MAMSDIRFDLFVPRNVIRGMSRELDLSGMKMSVNKLISYVVIGSIGVYAFLLAFFAYFGLLLAGIFVGLVGVAVYIVVLYAILEYQIDERKTKMEQMLPDYFQIASANLRSGIALERAMLLAARPEFGFFSDDLKEMSRQVFSGETLENSLKGLSSKYRSYQLTHAVRMMLEAVRYGGAMADLLEQLAKEMRNQQLIQKEVSGQLFMYSIFIVFAGLIAAPALYGLTSQMIVITDKIWGGILQTNPGGLPTTGASFLRPSPPQISPSSYTIFSLVAIVIITGFASLIVSAINSGSAVKGIRYVPLFIIVGLVIFVIVQSVVGGFLSGISGTSI